MEIRINPFLLSLHQSIANINMKTVLNLLLFLPLITFAQKQEDTLMVLPTIDGKITYSRIYVDSGFSKNDLFLKAQKVFQKLFHAKKGVNEQEDMENGIISARVYFSFNTTGEVTNMVFQNVVKTTITIKVKDDKYKVEITDFYKISSDANRPDEPLEETFLFDKAKDKPNWFTYYANLNQRVQVILDQIYAEMNQKLSTEF
jgi:hypothetical protein